MFEEGVGQVGSTTDPSGSLANLPRQDVQIIGGEVGQVGGRQVSPQVLDRVEFRGIGRESFDLQPMPMVPKEGHGVGAAVGGQTIPQQHDPAAHMAAETAQKGGHPLAVDRAGGDGQKQPHLLAAAAGCQGANQRQPFPVERLD